MEYQLILSRFKREISFTLKRLLNAGKAWLDCRPLERFEPDKSPEEVAGLILTALDGGVTLDMLRRDDLRKEYRDLLLKYKLIKVKWGRIMLTWRGVILIKLLKRIPELEKRAERNDKTKN